MPTDRRTYTAEFKARVVLELISGQKGLMEASREYHIKDSVLSRWKQEFLERAPSVFLKNSSPDEVLKQRVEDLERLAGRQAMELELGEKKYCPSPAQSCMEKTLMTELCSGGVKHSVVRHTLGLSRSTAYYLARVNKNNEFTTAIKAAAGQYPTYGRRRVAH